MIKKAHEFDVAPELYIFRERYEGTAWGDKVAAQIAQVENVAPPRAGDRLGQSAGLYDAIAERLTGGGYQPTDEPGAGSFFGGGPGAQAQGDIFGVHGRGMHEIGLPKGSNGTPSNEVGFVGISSGVGRRSGGPTDKRGWVSDKESDFAEWREAERRFSLIDRKTASQLLHGASDEDIRTAANEYAQASQRVAEARFRMAGVYGFKYANTPKPDEEVESSSGMSRAGWHRFFTKVNSSGGLTGPREPREQSTRAKRLSILNAVDPSDRSDENRRVRTSIGGIRTPAIFWANDPPGTL